MKNFLEVMNKYCKVFENLKEKFPELGDSKLKKREPLSDRKFLISLMVIYLSNC